MKFKKTALAVAILGIAAAPLAQADVTISGGIAIMLESDDSDATDGAFQLKTDDSSLNVGASHTMDNGLTAYGNYRLDGGLTDDAPLSDAVRVGIKGGFGDFRVGDVVNPIEFGQVAGDILTDIGDGNPSSGLSDVEEQAIGYTGAFGPVTLGLIWSPAPSDSGARGNRDTVGAGVKFALGGFGIGVGAGDIDEKSMLTVGASFAFAGASIGVALKDFDDDLTAVSAKVGYGIGGVSLGLTYEAIADDAAGSTVDGDNKIRLDVGYGLGGGLTASFRSNIFSDDGNDGSGDLTDYRVMLVKTF